MYRVSVIMPVYNAEKTVGRAIDSILKQSIYGVELILVNDGSTDASAHICEEYAKREPLLVEVIHQEKRGIAVARNRGLFKATGDYVYFASPKDRFDYKMIEDNLFLAKERNADLVVFGFQDTNQISIEGGFRHFPRMPHLSTQKAFRNHYRNFHHFFPYALHNKLYRRSHLVKNRIKFAQMPLNEAAFFNLKVYKNIQSVAFNRSSYCQHESQPQTDGYQEHLYDVHFKLATCLEEMFTEWGCGKEYRDLIVQAYFDAVHLEVENLCSKFSPYTVEQQENRMQEILLTKEIQTALNDAKFPIQPSPFLRSLLRMLQKGNSQAALQLTSRRNDTKKGTYKLSRWLRKLISG